MEIRTKKTIEKKKISNLDMMCAYLIYDTETGESNILIVDVHKNGLIIQNASNERSLIVLGANKNTEYNIIGKINNMDIINIDLR